MSEIIRIAIVEDEPLVMESLATAFGLNPLFQVCSESKSVEEALLQPIACKPDVMLLDIGLPGMSGLEGIRPLRERFPEVDIIMLTSYEEADKIFKALCNGAVAYLTKRSSIKEIIECAQTVHRGGSYMSPSVARKVVEYFSPHQPPVHEEENALSARQLQIIQGIVDGLSYKMLADRLNISMDTVRDHIKKIYRKLEVNSKAELIKISYQQGLLGGTKN